MKPRKQRRQEAKQAGVPFEPQYNESMKTGRGGPPKTHEEMYGIGYERFDDKYVFVSELVTEGAR